MNLIQLCVWIINCNSCVCYSKLYELPLFPLKFIDTSICVFHICLNISDLILCAWKTEMIYYQLSLLLLKFIGMYVIAFQLSIPISVFLFTKHSSKSMTAHLKLKENTDKLYKHITNYYSKRLFYLRLNYCNISEKGKSILKYSMFLKIGIRWLTQ